MKKSVWMVIVSLAFIGLLCITPNESWAFGRRFVGSGCVSGVCAPAYAPTACYTPVVEYVDRILPVAVPVPFTVAVPVVSYLYNGGYAPGYTPIYQALPAAAGAQVVVPQQPQMQPQAQAAPTRDTAPRTSALMNISDAELDYLINRIEQRLNARAGNTPQATSPPPPVPQATRSAPGAGSDADVVRVLSTPLGNSHKACVDCHTGAGSKGSVVIFNSPGVLNPSANWSQIWDAADAGRMPKEAQTNKQAVVSDADCEVLRGKMIQASAKR